MDQGQGVGARNEKPEPAPERLAGAGSKDPVQEAKSLSRKQGAGGRHRGGEQKARPGVGNKGPEQVAEAGSKEPEEGARAGA